jgi:hypothetical protein
MGVTLRDEMGGGDAISQVPNCQITKNCSTKYTVIISIGPSHCNTLYFLPLLLPLFLTLHTLLVSKSSMSCRELVRSSRDDAIGSETNKHHHTVQHPGKLLPLITTPRICQQTFVNRFPRVRPALLREHVGSRADFPCFRGKFIPAFRLLACS